jgi:hypothetical protein
MLEIADKLTCNLSREPDLDIGERLPDPTLLRRLRIEASEAVRTPATRPDRIKMIYDTIGWNTSEEAEDLDPSVQIRHRFHQLRITRGFVSVKVPFVFAEKREQC